MQKEHHHHTAAETHFGFETVPLSEKQGKVDDVFHKVADRYDLMNDLMSGGLHRVWKDALVTTLNPPRDRGAGTPRAYRHLDVAGGTGDVAFRILDAAGAGCTVTVLDINAEMLRVGEARAAKRKFQGSIDFVAANAEELPFADKTFDSYTIAFGIRNVPRIERALQEAFRVLKRGGRFLCLEFAPVDMPMLDKIYDRFSFDIIPPMGAKITGDAAPYQYLVESIRQFPRPPLFTEMIESAGFARVSHRPYSGGIANLHSGWKL